MFFKYIFRDFSKEGITVPQVSLGQFFVLYNPVVEAVIILEDTMNKKEVDF